MDQTCVDVKQPETNEEQCTHQDQPDADNTEEKLISSNKPPWKPWKRGRLRIRGEVDYFSEIDTNYSNQLDRCALNVCRLYAVREEDDGLFG